MRHGTAGQGVARRGKAWQLIGFGAAVLGVLIMALGIHIGSVILFVGLVTWLTARVLAWWRHA